MVNLRNRNPVFTLKPARWLNRLGDRRELHVEDYQKLKRWKYKNEAKKENSLATNETVRFLKKLV